MSSIDKVTWLCIEKYKVLFVRSKKHNYFINAGGKREDGETDEQVLVREVREELGVELLPETLDYAGKFKARTPDGRPLVSVCYFAEYRGELAPSGEIAELAWFTSADGGRTTEMGRKILQWLKEAHVIN